MYINNINNSQNFITSSIVLGCPDGQIIPKTEPATIFLTVCLFSLLTTGAIDSFFDFSYLLIVEK